MITDEIKEILFYIWLTGYVLVGLSQVIVFSFIRTPQDDPENVLGALIAPITSFLWPIIIIFVLIPTIAEEVKDRRENKKENESE